MEVKILAVDDEADVRDYIRDLLAGTEYACTFAPGFEEAVRLAAEPASRFDLLLTDILLPPFHGRDLANRVMGFRGDIKVLFMSGHPPRMLRDHGLLPARAPFLMKPFSRDQLLQSLREAAAEAPTWTEVVSGPRQD